MKTQQLELATSPAPIVLTGVAFDLEDKHYRRLKQEAEDFGVDPNTLARAILIRAMTQHDVVEDLCFLTASVDRDLESLRKDIALMAEALLVGAGRTDEEVAKRWVQNELTLRK